MKIKKADLGVALYILTAFIMFIVTIPSWLLDILLALNIGIAFFDFICRYVFSGSTGYVVLSDDAVIHHDFPYWFERFFYKAHFIYGESG